ncbi:glycoside hydrolase family 27 protein, partial [Lysobacter sp. 2RAB21]
MGLKFGIYSDAGRMTCGRRPGSQGYEFQDARTYAEWGADYLKYDWCYTGTRDSQKAYSLMADALRATGRDVVLSICNWG